MVKAFPIFQIKFSIKGIIREVKFLVNIYKHIIISPCIVDEVIGETIFFITRFYIRITTNT